MPDGGNGGGRYQTQNSNSNSTSTTMPLPGMQPKLEALLHNFWDRYGSGAEPTLYGGSFTAPMSTQTQQAFTNLFNRGAAGNPAVDAAGTSLTDTLSGKYLGKNPYLSDVLDAEFNLQNQRFLNEIAPTLDSKFVNSGRVGGGQHIDTTMRMVNDLGRAQADAAAKAWAGEYGAERNRMLQSASLAPGIAQQDYADILAQLQAGQGREGYTQKAIDEDIFRHNYGQTGRADWLLKLSQMLQGMFPGSQTTASSTSSGSSYMPGSGGGLGDALGLGLRAASMFSDRRDKTDIEKLGIDPLTGLPMHAYRYKGDPKSYPKVVGPMAQDIERAAPHLVREFGGRKVVRVGGLM
jgi:Chaperone of endosialidase